MENPPAPADHPLFAHQLQACRRAKAKDDEELINGTLIRAGYRRRALEEVEARGLPYGRPAGIDWWAPSPLVDLPRNTTNYRIPTFTFTPVSKHGVPRGANGEAHPDYHDPRRAVEDHFSYIGRQERADKDALRHGDYIGRSAARDGDDVLEMSPICTNISRNPTKRRAFAIAIYEAERSAKVHYLQACIDQVGWWAERAAEAGAEPWVKVAYRTLRAAARKEERTAKQKGREPRKFYIKVAGVSERQAYDRIVWAEGQPGWDKERKNLIFKSGPGGRVQYRMVFDLPHWMSAAERLETVRSFARYLGKREFMYVAAIHRPDAHNDSRNYHVHIDVYDRPCKYLKARKCWDFEVVEKKRNGKLRRPERQDKIADFARSPDGSNHRAHGAKVVDNLRKTFCELTNNVLERNSSPLRYHPGPFEALGLNLRPTSKLGGKRMAKEAIGLRTDGGDGNATRIWTDYFDAIYRRHAQSKDKQEGWSRTVRHSIQAVADPRERDDLFSQAAAVHDASLALLLRLHRFELGQAEIKMMRSRAETVLREEKKRAAAREESGAYKTTSLAAIYATAPKEAADHLALIDKHAPTAEQIRAEMEAIAVEGRALADRREAVANEIRAATMRAPAQSPAGVERLGHTRVALNLESLTHPSPPAGPAGKYDKVEIERVVSWLKAHRDEPSRFEFIEGKLLINAPKAVCSKLMRHAAHPNLRAELAKLVQDRQRVEEATVPLQGAAKPRVISTWSPPVKAQRPAHRGLPNPNGARALRGLSYGPRSPVNLPQPQFHRGSIVRTEGLSSSESEQRAESIRAESPQKRLDMPASGLAHVKPPREQSGSDPLSLLIPATAPSPPPQHTGRDAPQAGATAAPSPRQSRHGAPDAGGRCHGQGAQNGVTSAAASRLHPALKAHEAFVAQHGELADEASPLGTTMRFWRHVVSHDEVIVFRAPPDTKSLQNLYCCAEPTVATILKKYTAAACENSRVRNYLEAVLSSMPIASHEELQDLTPITFVALEDGFAPDLMNALQSRRSAQCVS